MRGAILLLLAGLAAAGAWALDGAAPFGRLALRLDMPGPALALLDDPLWRGAALHRLGRYQEAAEAFRQAGPRASFNRGNALARDGAYADALAAYDAVIARRPDDREARADYALVSTLYQPPVGEAREGGGIAATVPAERQTRGVRPNIGWVATRPEQADVRPRFEERRTEASQRWLATLPDDPGRYLGALIAAEHRRRQGLGLGAPPGEDPW